MPTACGEFTLTIYGDPELFPTLVTLHDIGLNHRSNFQAFFDDPKVQILKENLCVLHIDLPGQEDGAETLVKRFPSMNELVSGLDIVLNQFGCSHFFGLGQGAGAYLFSLFALAHPNRVTGLVLLNATSETATWTDLTYIRQYAAILRSKREISRGVQAFLRWYHFGRDEPDSTICPQNVRFEEQLAALNPANLADWMETFGRRPPLRCLHPNSQGIADQGSPCPVLLIVGRKSPHLEESRKMYLQSESQQTSILELEDCRNPLDESPTEVRARVPFLDALSMSS